jgi:high-affinity nickel-transport protein
VELAVALMLILLGMWNLTGILRRIRDVSGSRGEPAGGLHAHLHAHGDYVHSHQHGHGAAAHGHREDQTPQAWLDRRLGRLPLYQVVRPLVVGLIHGLAGSAAVALLVLAAIPDPRWAFVYLTLFGVGTIVGMVLLTVVIAVPLAYTSARFTGMERYLRTASGLLSLGFGLYLAYQIGVVDGLFARYWGGGQP